jgi:hypothetical protein
MFENEPEEGLDVLGLSERQLAMLAAIENNLTNITQALLDAKVGRSLHYYWYNTNPIYKREVDYIPEKICDKAETALLDIGLNAGDVRALETVLTARGKARGYGRAPEQQAPTFNLNVDNVSTEDLERLLKKAGHIEG